MLQVMTGTGMRMTEKSGEAARKREDEDGPSPCGAWRIFRMTEIELIRRLLRFARNDRKLIRVKHGRTDTERIRGDG